MTTPIVKIKGIGLHTAEILAENGFKSAEDLAATTEDALGKIHGFGPARAKKVIKTARALCDAGSDNEVASPSVVAMAEAAEPTEDLLVDDDIKAEESADIRQLEKKGKSKKKSKKKKKNKEDKKAGKEKKQKKIKKVKKTSAKKKKKKKK
ncbi:MAG: helix-hairpin-helix domain-containing protein [Desulfobulbaceae bacterium]|nr:helix-hairpin-helix domain-containing protein [Desulfobulbaceae bacterium]